jgi:hypothetical protein
MRIELRLPAESDWVKAFDPRDGTLFVVATPCPAVGQVVRLDVFIGAGGPMVTLRGQVKSHRPSPDGGAIGALVTLGAEQRDKINYVSGFVRGGLLNLRIRRRIPLGLPVSWSEAAGPRSSVARDINEEGIFVVCASPLPENSHIQLTISIPGRAQPLVLAGLVVHTVLPTDDDVPGMGIVFDDPATTIPALGPIMDELEQGLRSGALPRSMMD